MTLPEPVEVDQKRVPLSRLLLVLVGAGLLIGLVVGVGSWLVGTVAQTEAGLCRVTVAPCNELSVASVEQLSGIDLPEGTEVLSGYAQELGTLHEFRAEVVLPEGGRVTMSSAYGEDDSVIDVGGTPPGMYEVRVWSRPVADGSGYSHALTGTRDGRTVVVFDEQYAPAP